MFARPTVEDNGRSAGSPGGARQSPAEPGCARPSDASRADSDHQPSGAGHQDGIRLVKGPNSLKLHISYSHPPLFIWSDQKGPCLIKILCKSNDFERTIEQIEAVFGAPQDGGDDVQVRKKEVLVAKIVRARRDLDRKRGSLCTPNCRR